MRQFISYRSKIASALMALVFTLSIGAGVSLADSPHFIKADAQINNVTGQLICSWKEAGLGNNQQIAYTCTADGTATYVCVNRGGANPSAQNKETVSGPVSASGTFSSGKNGQITASLTVSPPGPGNFSCPPGQFLELASASYTNVTISDTTTPVSVDITANGETISTGCLLPNVKNAC